MPIKTQFDNIQIALHQCLPPLTIIEYLRPLPPLVVIDCIKTRRVHATAGIRSDITVGVPALKAVGPHASRITRNKAPSQRIQVTIPEFVEARLRVELAPGEKPWV